MRLTHDQISSFQDHLLAYYDVSGRHNLPWRLPDGSDFNPYKVVVSELMLQQTQVSRVLHKYPEFLQRFPTVQSLATVPLGDVLIVWQGLGYNRRAKFLWQAAQMVTNEYGGQYPDTLDELVKLPGIGKNTAGAVLAYAFNKPAVFIETNVRTVYIHHFFDDQATVADKEIGELLEQTLLPDSPRIFYWALMDYGSHLKSTVGNASTRSAHHVRQSPFQGSRRQVRGAVLRHLASGGKPAAELDDAINDSRLPEVLSELQAEGLIRQADNLYHLA